MKRSSVSPRSSAVLPNHPHQDRLRPQHQLPLHLYQTTKHNPTYVPSPRAMMHGPSRPLHYRRACPTSPYRTRIRTDTDTTITTLTTPHHPPWDTRAVTVRGACVFACAKFATCPWPPVHLPPVLKQCQHLHLRYRHPDDTLMQR